MMASISNYRVYDGYRLGSERPELLLTLDTHWISQAEMISDSRWESLAEWLGHPGSFSIPSANSLDRRLIKAYDLMCELVHIPACLTRVIINPKDQWIWVVPYYDPNISYQLCQHLLRNLIDLDFHSFDHQEQFFGKIQIIKQHFDTSLNNYFLLAAAKVSQVPTMALEPGTWQLGYCQHLRVFRSTVSERSSSLMLNWVKDKHKTAQLLNRMGYPGSRHQLIRDETHLKKAIREMDFPLVIKPRDQEQGRGVSADLRSEEAVFKAYGEALKFSKKILLEKHQEGNTHRLTVMNGELIRVVKRIPGGVIGDGVHTVDELLKIKLAESNSQRRIKRRGYVTLALDDEAVSILEQQGFTPASILPHGQFLKLRRRDNINAGGSNELVPLVEVHPDNVRLAQDIARDFHLDFVGIDLITQNIAESWQNQEVTICELNGQPQLAAFSDPELYPAILRSQLINHGQVPIQVFIYFTKSEASSLMQYQQRNENSCTYWTQLGGIYCEKNRISVAMNSTYESAKAALYRKEIDRLAMFLDSQEISLHGLPIPANQIETCWVLNHQNQERHSFLNSLGLQKHQVAYL